MASTPDELTINYSEGGVDIVKDSSANKCGVICSSFEILAGMIWSEPEFLERKPRFVEEVIAKLRKAYDEWWAETVPLMVNEDVPLAPERPFHALYRKQEAEGGIPAWQPPEL